MKIRDNEKRKRFGAIFVNIDLIYNLFVEAKFRVI
jgi:hypothetical protein